MTQDSKKIITRFPPSPTGGFHVGGARTALFNYLFTKQMGGMMYLRFEDTDKERSKKEYEKDILDALEWLGIDYEGPFRQSERGDIYKRYIEKMLSDNIAYISNEEGEGDRKEVIRFRNTNKKIKFNDLIHGDIEFETAELGNFVIAKSIEEPLYHLAVVIDDHEMGITHIIRGNDHISNTPRQILIQEAIGAKRPIYAHIPLILGPDKSKLSKRHGAKSTLEYRDDGFLSEAMINYLALLGWSPGNNREFLPKKEIMKLFDIKSVQKGGAVFDMDKFLWLNKQYINKMPGHEFKDKIKEFLPKDILKLPQYSEDRLDKVLPIIRERISVFSDVQDMSKEGALEYFFEKPNYNKKSLVWKTSNIDNTKKHLEYTANVLQGMLDDDFFTSKIKEAIWDYAEREGRGDVLWPMRYALSGVDRSPDPFTLAEIFGRIETVARLREAIEKIKTTK